MRRYAYVKNIDFWLVCGNTDNGQWWRLRGAQIRSIVTVRGNLLILTLQVCRNMQYWCIVACSMPYKPMLSCRKVCNAFMSPFTEVDGWNCQLLRASSVMKSWKGLNYNCNFIYLTYLRKSEIAPTMNLCSIYSVRFLFPVIHIENFTSVWKTKYVVVHVRLYGFRFKPQWKKCSSNYVVC